MTSTRAPTATLRLGLAFAVAVGLLFMHGLIVPGSSAVGHQTSHERLATPAPDSIANAHFGVLPQSESMHLAELCILMLAAGLGLAALTRAACGRRVDPRPGFLSVEALALIPHGPGPPWAPTHLELGVVLR